MSGLQHLADMFLHLELCAAVTRARAQLDQATGTERGYAQMRLEARCVELMVQRAEEVQS